MVEDEPTSVQAAMLKIAPRLFHDQVTEAPTSRHFRLPRLSEFNVELSEAFAQMSNT